MRVPKIAINGFGRIGRMVMRIAKLHRHFDVVAINDLAGPEHLAYAFKYDSVHGVYPGRIIQEGDRMTIDNDPITKLEGTIRLRLSDDYDLDLFQYQNGSGAPNFNAGDQFSANLVMKF